MDIRKQLREARGLTPTEAQLARTVLAMGERIQQDVHQGARVGLGDLDRDGPPALQEARA